MPRKPVSEMPRPNRDSFAAPILFGGFILVQAFGLYRYSLWKHRRDRERIEERSAQLALEPLLLAERDRWVVKPGGLREAPLTVALRLIVHLA